MKKMLSLKQTENLVTELIDKILKVFETEVPSDLMKRQESISIMYNTMINLLKNTAKLLKLDKEQVKKHIDNIWSGPKILN